MCSLIKHKKEWSEILPTTPGYQPAFCFNIRNPICISFLYFNFFYIYPFRIKINHN